jgi:hypothetical protein
MQRQRKGYFWEAKNHHVFNNSFGATTTREQFCIKFYLVKDLGTPIILS